MGEGEVRWNAYTLSYAGMIRIRFLGQRLQRVSISARLIRPPKVFTASL